MPRSRARLRPGAAVGRWSLRGIAFLYLGLFILLPVAAVLQAGFSNGLDDLRAALSSFGARNAIELTLVMAALTAIINGVSPWVKNAALASAPPFRSKSTIAGSPLTVARYIGKIARMP